MTHTSPLFRAALALVSLAHLTAPSAAIEFKFRLLSAGLDNSFEPLISGDNVIWIGTQGFERDVYRYHIPSGTRTALTETTTHLGRIDINGNYAAWDNAGVFLCDLATGVTRLIHSAPVTTLGPKISEDNVVWLEGRAQDTQYRIMHYNVDTMNVQQIVGFGNRDDLRISGNDVVWDQRVGEGPTTEEVFHYSLQTGITTRLTTNAIPDSYPEVSEGNVVWQTFDTEITSEVFRRNLQTGITHRLTTNAESDRTPEISGENIVWQGSTGFGAVSNIFHRNITTEVTTRLTNSISHPKDNGVPRVNGLSIVWNTLLDFDGRSREIFFHDLAVGITTQVTNNFYREEFANVFGRNIVFLRERPISTNLWDVYLATPIPEPSVPIMISTCVMVLVFTVRCRKRTR